MVWFVRYMWLLPAVDWLGIVYAPLLDRLISDYLRLANLVSHIRFGTTSQLPGQQGFTQQQLLLQSTYASCLIAYLQENAQQLVSSTLPASSVDLQHLPQGIQMRRTVQSYTAAVLNISVLTRTSKQHHRKLRPSSTIRGGGFGGLGDLFGQQAEEI